jgi:hypothetical protein
LAVTVNVPAVGGDEATSVATPEALATAVPATVEAILNVTTAPETNPEAVNVRDAPAVVVGVGVVRSGVAGGYALAGVAAAAPSAHVASNAVRSASRCFFIR